VKLDSFGGSKAPIAGIPIRAKFNSFIIMPSQRAGPIKSGSTPFMKTEDIPKTMKYRDRKNRANLVLRLASIGTLAFITFILLARKTTDTADHHSRRNQLKQPRTNSPADGNSCADKLKQLEQTVKELERKLYLKELRSYRLSGLICNNQHDHELPAVFSEASFKCYTPDYKRRACMDGKVDYPQACSKYNNDASKMYVPEPERSASAIDLITTQECKGSAAKGISICGEIALSLGDSVDPGQLAKGVSEAKILTTTGQPNYRPIWRKESLDFHLDMIKNGKDVSPLHYTGAHAAMQKAIDTHAPVKDKSVGVFGSISPWIESIIIHNGALLPTVTVDYNQPFSYDDRMKTELMSTMLEDDTQFDVAVSYSSIEHDGQGRYGDPLDPDGDLSAMKEVWLKVAPGGLFLLHVPMRKRDQYGWVSQRLYGPSRLPLLVRGWEYVGLATSEGYYNPYDTFLIDKVCNESPVLILRKPKTVGPNALLDTSKFGGLACDVGSVTCVMKGQ